jgi:hypothetical protein
MNGSCVDSTPSKRIDTDCSSLSSRGVISTLNKNKYKYSPIFELFENAVKLLKKHYFIFILALKTEKSKAMKTN